MQNWVLCKDQLPKTFNYYLVTKIFNKNIREVDIAYYDGTWHKAYEIIAWMELPKPCE